MEEGPEDGIRETVIVAIGYVIVKIDGLAGVLFHEAFVDDGAVFRRDEEARPTYPREVKGFLETRQGGDEPSRGHFEMVLARCIFVNGDRETIGDYNEMAALAYVHVGRRVRG